MSNAVQLELVKLDLATVLEEMNEYASKRLMNVDVKQLEGRTPDDFTMDVIVKVLDGTFSWDITKFPKVKPFLFGCLRGELTNFLRKIERRKASIVTIDEETLELSDSPIVIAKNRAYRDTIQEDADNR